MIGFNTLLQSLIWFLVEVIKLTVFIKKQFTLYASWICCDISILWTFRFHGLLLLSNSFIPFFCIRLYLYFGCTLIKWYNKKIDYWHKKQYSYALIIKNCFSVEKLMLEISKIVKNQLIKTWGTLNTRLI